MKASKKVVLVLQRSLPKTILWEIALSSNQVSVLPQSPDISLSQAKELLTDRIYESPSLVLIDSKMKNLDVIDLCNWCKKEKLENKIIITSDQDSIFPTERQYVIEQGAVDVLPRLELENLNQRLKHNLEQIYTHLSWNILEEDTWITTDVYQGGFSLQSLSPLSEEGIEHSALNTIPHKGFLVPTNYKSDKLIRSTFTKLKTNIISIFPKDLYKRVFIVSLLILALSICVALSLKVFEKKKTTSIKMSALSTQDIYEDSKVVARGKIVPELNVIKLSVPNAQDSRVDKIFVKQGDRVQANQVIAILQGADQRKTDLEAAQTNVKLLQAKLAKVKEGDEKPAALDVQRSVLQRLRNQSIVEFKQKQSEIDSARASINEAQLNYERQRMLYSQGAVSRADLDTARKEFEVTQASLSLKQADLEQSLTTSKSKIVEEQARLEQLQQVRPVDIAVAQRELEKAVLEAQRSRFSYEDTLVRVPVSGQILRINTKVGEQVNTDSGIVDLGRTQQMYVLAEIYETDLRKVRKNQRAKIVSEYGGFKGDVYGTVSNVDLQVGKPTLLNEKNDPTTDENSRVVQVSIRIDSGDSVMVAGLTNMQVRVTIESESGKSEAGQS
jgi:HlyD family secretion protein